VSYELVVVTMPDEWERYHFIRRTELFEARGRVGVYDAAHPDEFIPNHFPLLLKWDGWGLGTTRLDVRGGGVAIVRLVAIAGPEQGKGHGRVLADRTEAFARQKGINKLLVNAAANAAGFYRRLGFVRNPGTEPNLSAGMPIRFK
jgi:N-acetylglutamate synthase-like GNAT family acetyltransferase